MTRTLTTALLLLAAISTNSAQQRSIDEFFAAFTAEWLRLNPNQAASTRFFSGEEQGQFERQMTPLTPEWRRRRVALAERSLAELNQAVKSARQDDLRRNSGLTDSQVSSCVRRRAPRWARASRSASSTTSCSAPAASPSSCSNARSMRTSPALCDLPGTEVPETTGEQRSNEATERNSSPLILRCSVVYPFSP
jgi:hypothetical protein